MSLHLGSNNKIIIQCVCVEISSSEMKNKITLVVKSAVFFPSCFGGPKRSISFQNLRKDLLSSLTPGSAPAELGAEKSRAKDRMLRSSPDLPSHPANGFSNRYKRQVGDRGRLEGPLIHSDLLATPATQPSETLSHLDIVHVCTQMLWRLPPRHVSD